MSTGISLFIRIDLLKAPSLNISSDFHFLLWRLVLSLPAALFLAFSISAGEFTTGAEVEIAEGSAFGFADFLLALANCGFTAEAIENWRANCPLKLGAERVPMREWNADRFGNPINFIIGLCIVPQNQ